MLNRTTAITFLLLLLSACATPPQAASSNPSLVANATGSEQAEDSRGQDPSKVEELDEMINLAVNNYFTDGIKIPQPEKLTKEELDLYERAGKIAAKMTEVDERRALLLQGLITSLKLADDLKNGEDTSWFNNSSPFNDQQDITLTKLR